MTTFRTLSAALLLGALLMMVGTGCDSGTTSSENLLRVDDRGNTQFEIDALRSRLDDLPNPYLSRQNWHRTSLLVIKCCESITYNKPTDSPHANTVYNTEVFF